MINPILASSARRRMRSARTPVLITLYGVLIFLFGLGMAFGQFANPSISIYVMRQGMQAYAGMLAIQFALILLITPAMTAGSIAGERERQTLDMLLVTNTGSLRIVAGKLLESLGYVALLLVAALPSMCLTLVTGGVTLADVLTGALFLLVTAFAALSVGVFASAVFRRTVTATVMAYLIVFFIGVVTMVPLVLGVWNIGSNYDAMFSSTMASSVAVIGGADGPTSIGIGVNGFIYSPAMGLMALIADQTGLLKSTLMDYSYTMYRIYDYLDFSAIKWENMAFMAGAGLLLDLLAACFVRPREARMRRRSAKK